MKRARTVAQAAWTRPPLKLPSWSCIGPRRRHVGAPSAGASLKDEGDIHVSMVEASVLTTEAVSESLLEESTSETAADHDNQMSEVELWQQLEEELYRRQAEETADVVEDISEEETAVASDSRDQENLLPEVAAAAAEPQRFFPPGRIMHIVPFVPLEGIDLQDGGSKVGIFMTPRSLYGKLRLSQMMINDHYMPSYRRNMESLIEEFEEAVAGEDDR